jgi:hypothetical protein
MKKYALCLLLIAAASAAYPQAHEVLMRDEFDSLANWKPVYFPKIARHSSYTIVKGDPGHLLKTESNASASAIVYKDPYIVYDYPRLKWRWKVDNVYKKANPRTKQGDDYPIRVYVLFKYDPEHASVFQRITYDVAKLLYGEYPPDSGLNYVWASQPEKVKMFPSPYTDRLQMIVLEAGLKDRAWADEDVNVLADYQKAFGKKPPAMATLGIMNDSDNTGQSSVSFVKYIEIYK